jgi:membrane-associated protease RseP (regulator of RpoE activity)
VLLVLTVVTLCFAGGLWEGADAEARTLADYLRPSMLGRILAEGSLYAIAVLLILGSHEMGHYLACRRYGIPATLPFFIPGPPPLGSFGAVIRIRGAIPHRRALFDVAAAGPIAGFLVTLPVLVIGLLTASPVPDLQPPAAGTLVLGEPVVMALLHDQIAGPTPIRMNSWLAAAWVGLLVTALNLFPVGQLDGGHAAYAVSRPLHRRLAWMTIAAVLAMIGAQFAIPGQQPFYLVWFLVLLWMRDRHPPLIDDGGALDPGRKLLAIALAVIFLLSFTYQPIRVLG